MRMRFDEGSDPSSPRRMTRAGAIGVLLSDGCATRLTLVKETSTGGINAGHSRTEEVTRYGFAVPS